MTGDERDRFDQTVVEYGKNLQGLRSEFAALVLCDENGESLGFTEAEVKQLGAKSGAVTDRIFEHGKALSGMGADHVEEAEKNSQADQSENSG